MDPKVFVLRTTANREDQVLDFVSSNAHKKKMGVFSVIRAHGMRGYIFVEAASRQEAEMAAFNVPYARGILPNEVDYKEIEHLLEQVKVEMNIRKNDIVEIISGPFRREQAKVTRIDRTKEEVVVELLEAAVPIPITVKMDAVKVIRRDSDEGEEEEKEEVPLMPMAEEKPREFVMPGQDKKPEPVEEKEEKKEGEKKEESKEEEKKKESKEEEESEEEKEESPEEKALRAAQEYDDSDAADLNL